MAFGNQKTAAEASSSAATTELNEVQCFTDTNGVITTTMFDVPGYRIDRVMGTVYGITVRSRNWAAGLGMVLKSIAGGELKWFTNLLYNARNDAIARIVAECKQRGGNAIIALRFDQGDVGGFTQITAYGTAAFVKKIDPDEELPYYPQLFPDL